MSFRARDWRDSVLDSRLDRTAKLVALVLSTYIDGEGKAFPALATIGDDASLSRPAVGAAIDRLEKAGLIRVSRSRGRSSHHYTALIPTVKPLPGLVISNSKAACGLPGDQQESSHPPIVNLTPSNSKRALHESVESAESGALDAAPALEGGTARAHFDPEEVARQAAEL